MNELGKIILAILLGVGLAVLGLCSSAIILQWVLSLFNLSITFIQSIGIVILLSIVGSFFRSN